MFIHLIFHLCCILARVFLEFKMQVTTESFKNIICLYIFYLCYILYSSLDFRLRERWLASSESSWYVYIVGMLRYII